MMVINKNHIIEVFFENRINSYDLDKLCSHLNNHKKSYGNTNLNHKITSKEIKKSIKKLKAKKAAGLDRISNEMLKCSFPYLSVFVKLFNLIFEAMTISPIWCQGLISPLFKSDDKLNPENYRPI